MSRFGLGEGIAAPFRSVSAPSAPPQVRYFMGASKKPAPPVLTSAQASELKAWLKGTTLTQGLPAAFLTAMQAPDVDWDVTAYLKKIAPTKNEADQQVGDVWKGRLGFVSPVLETIATNFIYKSLGYPAGTGESARLVLRLGEAVALASFIYNDGSSYFFPSEKDRASAFDPKKMLSYGFYGNNTVNNREGITFKTAFGLPKDTKGYNLLGIESRKGSTKGNYFMLISWCLSNLYYLYRIIGQTDRLRDMTPRQKKAMIINAINVVLPGHIGLTDGRKLYSPRSIPSGAVSNLRLDLEPAKVAVGGAIPKASEASGWFSMLEYMVEDAVIPPGFLSTRDNRRAPLPTRGVAIEYVGAPAARQQQVAQAETDQAAAEEEAAALQEASDAFDQEQADKADKAASRRTTMTVVGSVAAVAGAYYYSKHGGF
jgi:hypothetical protein